MKKKVILAAFAAATMSFSAHAQSLFTPGGTVGTSTVAGKVGIGTNAPAESLQIIGGLKVGNGTTQADRDASFIKIGDGDYIRIGEWEQGDRLTLEASQGYSLNGGVVRINNSGSIAGTARLNVQAYASTEWLSFRRTTGYGYAINNPSDQSRLEFTHTNDQGVKTSNVLSLLNTGAVGIGTSCVPSGYKLAIAGKVICDELKVKLNSSGCWPDYVFSPQYKLKSLTEVEAFIKENKRLPEVPSAEVVENEGISTSEMFKIQMEKIEELTLYMIEMKKEISTLKAENAALKVTK